MTRAGNDAACFSHIGQVQNGLGVILLACCLHVRSGKRMVLRNSGLQRKFSGQKSDSKMQLGCVAQRLTCSSGQFQQYGMGIEADRRIERRSGGRRPWSRFQPERHQLWDRFPVQCCNWRHQLGVYKPCSQGAGGFSLYRRQHPYTGQYGLRSLPGKLPAILSRGTVVADHENGFFFRIE